MLPPKKVAISEPDSRIAQSSSGSWLPASTAGGGAKSAVPAASSTRRRTHASTRSRGNSIFPVTRLTGIACSATSS